MSKNLWFCRECSSDSSSRYFRQRMTAAWIYLTVLIVCWSSSAHLSGAEQPILAWTQKSHQWTKIRGIFGDPNTWIYNSQQKTYVTSEYKRNRVWYALGYDPSDFYIYWSDQVNKRIYRQPVNDSLIHRKTDNVHTVLEGTSDRITGLAVDWYSGNVYLSDALNNFIAVATRHPQRKDIYRVVASRGVFEPAGVAVNPPRGAIYWANTGYNPSIETASLTGADRKFLAQGGVGRPSCLTLDMAENKLYWVDSDSQEVMYLNLDFNSYQVNSIPLGTNYNLPRLAVSQNHMFFTSPEYLGIFIYDKSGAFREQYTIDADPNDIILIGDRQTPPTACAVAQCDHLCIYMSDKPTCLCRQGYYLQLDGKSCGTSQPRYIYSRGTQVWNADVTINVGAPHLITKKKKVPTATLR